MAMAAAAGVSPAGAAQTLSAAASMSMTLQSSRTSSLTNLGSCQSQAGLFLLQSRNAGRNELRVSSRAQWVVNSQSLRKGSSECENLRSFSPHLRLDGRKSFLVGNGKNGKGEMRNGVRCSASSSASSRPASQPRFIQHKQEAFWFYRFLSIVYDHVINPGHWTEDMREDALVPADLNDKDLVVVDVGGGTGFATLGIVKTVDAKNVTILDQSPHQLAKAKEKAPLKDCTIVEGDAEDLPFATDYADRYVSAGSIEYWPDPQRGIKEAFRVLKKGGKACLIGPVHPTFWLSRFFADVWMLFPTEDEYTEWFTKAGFTDVQIKRIGPKWYRGVRRHGLIMGCSVTGVKADSGDSPLELGPKAEDSNAPFNIFTFAYRFLVGSIASLYYVIIPIYMWLKDLVIPKGQPI